MPALRALANRPDIEQISETVDSAIGTNDKLSRLIKLYLCHRYSGIKLKVIGTYFSIGEFGVTQASRRLSGKLEKDKMLRKKSSSLKTS